MPDYNSDKERGQGKKKWVVQPADTNIQKSVKTGKGELALDDKGRCLIADESLAREIQKDHSRDMVVSRIFMDDPADRGHHYFFGQLRKPLPWHRYNKDGFRIKDMSPEESEERDKFEQGYAERSGTTVERLHELGQYAVPCDCDYDYCPGWQMTNINKESGDGSKQPREAAEGLDELEAYEGEGIA